MADYKLLGVTGNSAEVLMGGEVTRLPLEGEGDDPPVFFSGPSKRFKTPACCCASGVSRSAPEDGTPKSVDPRRSLPPLDDSTPVASTDRCVGVWAKKLGYSDGGYLDMAHTPGVSFENLIGKDLKVLLFPEDTPILPSPAYWIQWDCKPNIFKVVKLPPKGITLYLWVEASSGTVGKGFAGTGTGITTPIAELAIEWFDEDTKKKLTEPRLPATYPLSFKIWDTNRLPWDQTRGLDPDQYAQDPPITQGDLISVLFNQCHPLGVMEVGYQDYSTLPEFLEWYKHAPNFNYERVS